MRDTDVLRQQLPFVLERTHFGDLGRRIEGKVRDSYAFEGRRLLIATDRLSCFDRVLTTVPFKGEVLTQLARYWFERSRSVVPNHIISIPDPSVMEVHECTVLPIEVVVRGYLAGSALRDYQAGRAVSGVELPAGLKPYQQLPEPLITPSTKAEHGTHDEPISEAEILRRKIVSPDLWNLVRKAALALFHLGSKAVAGRGLLLADTKYEFGILDGALLLVDEVHTLDSSRFWEAESYDERLRAGELPVMLDKEPTRQWLLQQGFSGDGKIPEFTDTHRVELSEHYISAFERITGEKFVPVVGSSIERMVRNLGAAGFKVKRS